MLSAGEAEGLLYYTMPLVDGESLRARLDRGGELPVHEAIKLLREIAAALAYAHRQGVVHRDVKPDNVLVSDGFALVTDFGVAKAIARAADAGAGSATLTSLGVALGTPAYMAPEQAAADPQVDHRADIYAFGCVAYELLTGQPPFAGRAAQTLFAAHAVEAPEPVARRRPNVPNALAALVMRCLEKRPADRPQRADEIVRALDTLDTLDATSPRPARARSARRRAAAWVAAGALAAAAAVGAWRALARRAPAPNVDAGVVAVLPFRVASADSSLRYLREGMLDLLAAKLSDRPRAVDPRAVLAAWRRAGGTDTTDPDPDRTLRLAAALGAGRLLAGTVVGGGARVVMSARLLAVPEGTERATASATGAAGDVAVLVDSLAAKLLAQDAGERAASVQALGGIPLAAVQAYLAGQVATRRGEYARAAEEYGRAIDIDSTFALAALRLLQAAGWVTSPRAGAARAVVTRYRDRLGPRDQWSLPPADPRERPTSSAARIERLERAVSAVPDDPALWYALGDEYYHRGLLLGDSDIDRRSARAFERALALDSTFRPAFEHLPSLYADFLDDSARDRRARAMMARDTTGDFWPVTKFMEAATAEERRALIPRLLRGPIRLATVAAVGMMPELRDWTPEDELLLRRLAELAVSAQDRALVAGAQYRLAMIQGQPARAARVYGPAVAELYPASALDAVFWDGDSAAVAPRLTALARASAGAVPAGGAARDQWVEAVFIVAQEAAARGQTAPVREAVQRLLAVPPIDTEPRRTVTPRRYALVLDAQLAAATHRPDAATRLVPVRRGGRTSCQMADTLDGSEVDGW